MYIGNHLDSFDQPVFHAFRFLYSAGVSLHMKLPAYAEFIYTDSAVFRANNSSHFPCTCSIICLGCLLFPETGLY